MNLAYQILFIVQGDACSSPKKEGEGNVNLQRWYYNGNMRDCDLFYYKGRKGNQNNFLSQEECVRQCVPGKISIHIFL